ncbi:hypothetical protein [Alteribacillus sp. YIM 98480]|uniref:hypothetical protein n=1 Tax=Alteribacillus sp. YIM 98480 TaxID=2606599 RepID=UPI00131D6835|nr:hypothetical protein [Alteribacillus sp. YIM 98480]
MVIQSNMSSKAIVEIWGETVHTFKKHDIPITNQTLEILVENKHLSSLLQELNISVGSSDMTCIKGG